MPVKHVILLLTFGRCILSQLENRLPLKPVLGAGQCCTITLLHMNRLNKTESAIIVPLMRSLLPEDLHSEFILWPFW